MRNNKAEAYGRILYEQLVKDSCDCQESFCVANLIEETKRISVFLQEKFKGSKLTNEYIFYIFEEILKRIKESEDTNKDYYNKKIVYILLNYVKDNFFSLNINIGKKIVLGYVNNPTIKPYFLGYLRDMNKDIQKSSIEPYLDIAFSLCLQGISEHYDIIDDINSNNFEGLKSFLDEKIELLINNSDYQAINELCILFETLNQLGIVINIGGEQRKVGIKFYKNILIAGIKKSISLFLKGKGCQNVDSILYDNDELIFSREFLSCLGEEDIIKLKKLQNIYGLFLCNYEGNIDYNQSISNTGTIEDTIKEMNAITKIAQSNILYGLRLRKDAIKGAEDENNIKKTNYEAGLSADISITYLNLKRIKQTIKILEFNNGNPDIDEEAKTKILKLNKEKNSLSNLITKLYKTTKKEGVNIDNSNDIINDFITLKKPSYDQLVIIYNLVISSTISIGVLQFLIKRLIGLNGNRSTSFQKYKLQTIEAILGELGNRTTLCEMDCNNYSKCNNNNNNNNNRNAMICRDIIGLIENFITSLKNSPYQKGHYFVFNYGKLYLSLSYIFSSWDRPDLIKKAKEYLAIFQEKYSYTLNNFGNNINRQVDYEKLETEHKISLIVANIKKSEESRYSVLNSIQEHIDSDTLERRRKIESTLFDTINKIQKQKGEFSHDYSEKIKSLICETISVSLFDGLCEISIVDKGKKIKVGKFEKIEKIEGGSSDIDIIFKYNSLYEENFRYLFEKEKNFIKERLMLFIISNIDYLAFSSNNKTLIGVLGELMESKDSYTKGHIKRVADFSYAIGKNLGWTIRDLSKISLNAIYHDIGKRKTPDHILKKTGKLSPEDKAIMDLHAGNGIYEGFNIGTSEDNMLGMVHHTKFWSPQSDETLIFNKLLKQIKSGVKIDPSCFSKLAGNNIPIISRIIMIGDVIDAIASRRIYDDRSARKIGEILDIIDSELLKCSGLIRTDSGAIKVNSDVWKEVSDDIIDNIYKLKIGNKYYIPTKNVEITFDASIVFVLLNNNDAYSQIISQIISSDKENVRQKIIEIDENIKILRGKHEEYQKTLEEIRHFGSRNIKSYFKGEGKTIEENDVNGLLSSLLKDDELITLIERSKQLKIAFTPDNHDELARLNNLQIQMIDLERNYDS